jgi:hypothetical protein
VLLVAKVHHEVVTAARRCFVLEEAVAEAIPPLRPCPLVERAVSSRIA